MLKIGMVVKLKQGDTRSNWVIADRATGYSDTLVQLKHEDELDAAGGWMPESTVKLADISDEVRNKILAAFAETKRGRQIVRSLTH